MYYSIDEVVSKNSKWKKLSIKICGDKFISEEVLQNFYISLMNRKSQNFPINDNYIYTGLTNQYIKYLKNEDLDSKDEYDDNYFGEISTTYNIEIDINEELFVSNILNEIENIYWFDRQIFKLIHLDGYSMRGLAKETNISFNTIRNSYISVLDYLNKKFKNQYQDYLVYKKSLEDNEL